MALPFSRLCIALLPLIAAAAITPAAIAQRPDAVPLMQPGAPGQPTKTLTQPTVGTAVKAPTDADVKFMQGMVMHHSQAVEMVALMPGRTTNPQLLELGQRISISQGDEIKFMKRWLSFYDKPLEDDSMKMDMAAMPGMKMDTPMDMDMRKMPGMLSAIQMEALRNAKGPLFDHLFLTGMIQHHTGALTMVTDLFHQPGSGQEPQLFDFTSDVDVTQKGEIDTMQNMLAKEKR
jgi:uncharacterized protein (DUF305 family)